MISLALELLAMVIVGTLVFSAIFYWAVKSGYMRLTGDWSWLPIALGNDLAIGSNLKRRVSVTLLSGDVTALPKATAPTLIFASDFERIQAGDYIRMDRMSGHLTKVLGVQPIVDRLADRVLSGASKNVFVVFS